MTLDPNDRAAAVGVGIKNVQFQVEAQVLPRKILIIATYDPAITTIVDEEPVQVFSPEDAGSQFGFGWMAHRLTVASFAGSSGIPTFIQPQSEALASAQAVGTIDFAGTTGVLAGTLALYYAGLRSATNITKAQTDEEVAAAVAASINAVKEFPVTATVLTTVVTITSKSTGTWGNFITIRDNIKAGDVTPTGITFVITDMAGGSGIPLMVDALDGLGTGDDANEGSFTDLVHGYGQDTTTFDAISAYVGEGNEFTGLYDKLVARPFRALTGDTDIDTAALTALIAIGEARKEFDRANGIVAVPGSAIHPSEIAALSIGNMALINNSRAEQTYIDQALSGVDPGDKATRWTSDYDNRSAAVEAGISPTKVVNGVVQLQNVMTFYHPDNVPAASNGFASMRNISITQNVLKNEKALFENERFKQITIVADIAKVTSSIDKQKVMDVETVKDFLVTLFTSFEGKAWLYSADFSIESLNNVDAVVIRSGQTGFDINQKLIYSGEGGIYNNIVEFDTSIAVLGG